MTTAALPTGYSLAEGPPAEADYLVLREEAVILGDLELRLADFTCAACSA